MQSREDDAPIELLYLPTDSVNRADRAPLVHGGDQHFDTSVASELRFAERADLNP